ncbi:MAG: Crp/Fnr family transcriptional regulator [Flavobacterium sp.]
MKIFEGNHIEIKKIDKGTLLLSKGSNCKYAYKINKGCLKSYVLEKSGKEHILQFATEDWIITDVDSLLNSKPASIFIEAIEDSEVIVLDKALFENINRFEKATLLEQNTKLIRNLVSLNKRLIALLSSTAEERYLDFIETYPALLQRLPLKSIASYIGVTPEYLSDIRRKIINK